MTPDNELASMLARWHEWRDRYSFERGLSRIRQGSDCHDEDEELEASLMRSVEAEIAKLPADEQLALQHLARAESLGNSAFINPRLGDESARENLMTRATNNLRRRLLQSGLI